MGGVVSGGVKKEIEEAVKQILGTFTKEYVKSYAVHLVKKIKADAQAEPEDWKLDERPVSISSLHRKFVSRMFLKIPINR